MYYSKRLADLGDTPMNVSTFQSSGGGTTPSHPPNIVPSVVTLPFQPRPKPIVSPGPIVVSLVKPEKFVQPSFKQKIISVSPGISSRKINVKKQKTDLDKIKDAIDAARKREQEKTDRILSIRKRSAERVAARDAARKAYERELAIARKEAYRIEGTVFEKEKRFRKSAKKVLENYNRRIKKSYSGVSSGVSLAKAVSKAVKNANSNLKDFGLPEFKGPPKGIEVSAGDLEKIKSRFFARAKEFANKKSVQRKTFDELVKHHLATTSKRPLWGKNVTLDTTVNFKEIPNRGNYPGSYIDPDTGEFRTGEPLE